MNYIQNNKVKIKTIGIYLFEKIPSFEFEAPGILKLEKFQLFNEYRFRYSGSNYGGEQIEFVKLPNIDSNYYSKWIHGIDFEKKFPVGSEILFDFTLFEFSNSNRSYTVVSSKKNAILIIDIFGAKTSISELTIESLINFQMSLNPYSK